MRLLSVRLFSFPPPFPSSLPPSLPGGILQQRTKGLGLMAGGSMGGKTMAPTPTRQRRRRREGRRNRGRTMQPSSVEGRRGGSEGGKGWNADRRCGRPRRRWWWRAGRSAWYSCCCCCRRESEKERAPWMSTCRGDLRLRMGRRRRVWSRAGGRGGGPGKEGLRALFAAAARLWVPACLPTSCLLVCGLVSVVRVHENEEGAATWKER